VDAAPKPEPVLADGVSCDICGKPMYIRQGKFGTFYGCTDYPKCKGIKPVTTEVICPKCHEGKIIERYSKKAKRNFMVVHAIQAVIIYQIMNR